MLVVELSGGIHGHVPSQTRSGVHGQAGGGFKARCESWNIGLLNVFIIGRLEWWFLIWLKVSLGLLVV